MKNIYLPSLFNIDSPTFCNQIIYTNSFRSQFGKRVNATTYTALYKWQFQNNTSISFAQRMSIPVYAEVISRGWEKVSRKIIM